jgi:hypothetical protein
MQATQHRINSGTTKNKSFSLKQLTIFEPSQFETLTNTVISPQYFLTVLWIRIRKDPHHFGNLDPHPHQIKIRIRIIIYPDPDSHQFADVKPKCMENKPLSTFSRV